MEKDKIRAKMDKLMTQIKAYIKASDFVVKQFRKKGNRETDNYKLKIKTGLQLNKKALTLLSKYDSLSKQLYRKG